MRIAPPSLPPHHSDPAARDFQSSIPVEALLRGCHLDVQCLLQQQFLSSAAVQYCGLLPVDRRRPQYWTVGGDHSTGPRQRTGIVAERGTAHPDDTLGGALQPGWRTGSPWLLDRCDEEAGREEQSSPTFDLR